MDKIFKSTIKQLAIYRSSIHNKHKTSRPLSYNYEYIGLLGEITFAEEFNLMPDLSFKPKGDGRYDFKLDIGTIDVKTAFKPYNLLREKNKNHADILVLVKYNKELDECFLIGWEYDKNMIKCNFKDFGYGIINYYKPNKELKTIRELKILLNVNLTKR